MSFPDYLIIGAQKAGTTWLQSAVAQHPGIFAPQQKEIHFFDKKSHFQRGPDWYAQWFHNRQPSQITGEATPNYLWIPESEAEAREAGHLPDIPERVHAFNPDLRWIAVLRDPVQRAVSAYFHHIRAGRIHPDQPISQVWHRFGIRSAGNYDRQLQPWLSLFPPQKGLVLSFERDVCQRPQWTIATVFRFLNVDPSFHPSLPVQSSKNVGSSHFLLRLHHQAPFFAKLLSRCHRGLGRSWKRFHIPVTEEEKQSLRHYYQAHNPDYFSGKLFLAQ